MAQKIVGKGEDKRVFEGIDINSTGIGYHDHFCSYGINKIPVEKENTITIFTNLNSPNRNLDSVYESKEKCGISEESLRSLYEKNFRAADGSSFERIMEEIDSASFLSSENSKQQLLYICKVENDLFYRIFDKIY